MIIECLESLYAAASTLSFEIIVIDNASTDGSPERIAANFPEVKLVRNQRNLGFAKANNIGIEAAKGDYYLLLNNDTTVLAGSLETLIAEAQGNDDTGILGCRLLNPDNSLQYSAGIFPNILTEFLDQTMLHRLFPIYKLGSWNYDQPREVDWVTGAAMLARRKMIEDVGALDASYFMFLEDVDLCWRAWQAGWKVRFTPKASIVHHKGYSSQLALTEMLVADQASMYRFFRKHYTRWHVQLLRLVVSLGCIFRGVYWVGKGLFGHKRQRGERLAAYSQILGRTWFDCAFVWGENNVCR